MKKYYFFLLFLVFPYFLFSESVGIFSGGVTRENNKVIDYSKPMASIGFDIHGIFNSSGVTFFWNNACAYARDDLQIISSEVLLGGTFRRDKSLNISFGIGARLATPFNIENSLEDQFDYVLAGVGGTLGFSYYFTNAFGFSIFVSDFVSKGYYIRETSAKDLKVQNNEPFYKGLSNTVFVKLGMNIRLGGKLSFSPDEEFQGEAVNSKGNKNNTNGDISSRTSRLPRPQEILSELN